VSLSLSLLLEAHGVRDRTLSVLHKLLSIATCGTDGVQPPIPRLALVFVLSSPFSVATYTFHVDTGNSGGSGRNVMRGTEALPPSSSAAAAGLCTRLASR